MLATYNRTRLNLLPFTVFLDVKLELFNLLTCFNVFAKNNTVGIIFIAHIEYKLSLLRVITRMPITLFIGQTMKNCPAPC